MRSLEFLEEPLLTFGFDQELEYTRDGLFLYGPIQDANSPKSIRIGVIGTKQGIALYYEWVDRISRFIPRYQPPSNPGAAHHTSFPGFEGVFRAAWPKKAAAEIEISESELASAIRIRNRYEAVKRSVEIFLRPIQDHLRNEEAVPDVWIVVVPDEIYKYGRPLSNVPSEERVDSTIRITRGDAKKLHRQPSLFEAENEEATVYEYAKNFRRQLKARLLESRAVLQLVRERTLTSMAGNRLWDSTSGVQDGATVAWNICTAVYYKAGGRPWRLAHVRPGVCYVGLVFKQTQLGKNKSNACCGAQMFLGSGEGVVFRGAIGPWYSQDKDEYHLDRLNANLLMSLVVDEYRKKHAGNAPLELFIHGQTRFAEDEWRGFKAAVPSSTRLVGVRISQNDRAVKLFRRSQYPVLRGTVLKTNDSRAYLWTSGFVPRLGTYLGPETPNPIFVEVHRGESELTSVLSDIFALTKINYNSCIFNDRVPITIKFANAIGDIIVSAPVPDLPPLPFKFYI